MATIWKIETTTADVQEALRHFERSGSLEFALGEINRRREAVQALQDRFTRPEVHQLLVEMAEAMLGPIAHLMK